MKTKNSARLAGLMAIALLAACKVDYQPGGAEKDEKSSASAGGGLSFADVRDQTVRPRPDRLLQTQVVLERLGFSSGTLDGKDGANFRAALRAFQDTHDLNANGKLDEPTVRALARWTDVPATRVVRIPADFARGPFVPNFPKDAQLQAKLPVLGYRNLVEALAERFHTTPETLVALNRRGTVARADAVIQVPAVADIAPPAPQKDDRGWSRTLQWLAVSPDQPKADRVVVDKSEGVLRAFDTDGRLIAQFPATMGSEHDPLPLGQWKIQGVSRNPDFHYNPKLFWDVSDSKQPVLLKPGPNGPVGVVWIDLSKPHYGIHGTGEPQSIGRAESHGCVRLTNWDAARLAGMVEAGTKVLFQA
ncbi:L,D-transpeptidase family protein [Sphingobium sp. AN558]|uniref:L,D-transpeptidase family protein n=1 Tax=Sphingobium sp. AN558 TaxID=3133442 RepID=UPI0030C2E5E5